MKAITNMSTTTFALARGRFAFTTLNSLFFPSLAVGIRLFDKFVYNTLCTIAMDTQYKLVRPNFLHQMFHKKMILLNSSEYRNIATTAGFQKISTSYCQRLTCNVWSSLDSYHMILCTAGSKENSTPKNSTKVAKLDEIKQQHGDGPVVGPEPHRRLYITLTK